MATQLKYWLALFFVIACGMPQFAFAAVDDGIHALELDFQGLGVSSAAQLHGLDGNLVLPFGVRLDESVAQAKLTLRFTYSPALLPDVSHLKIVLNKEVIATLPLPKQQTSAEVVREVEIDPRYFTDFNQLSIQLIGHYTLDCEDAMHTSLWASLSNKSSLHLSLKKLDLSNDLEILPAPFFDRRDNRRLVLPFVFGADTSADVLHAAGVVSSWFGAQASYRGAAFPALLNQMPDRHAVVFATNKNMPEGLGLVMVKVPTISIMRHPTDGSIKLLVLQGQDDAQLRMAADALVLGQVVLTGPSATVTSVKYDPRRPAYDAPSWLRSDRPVKLGELVEYPSELQAVGHVPDPIRVNLRMPPDLMTWNRNGVPIELKYRYTPLVEQDNSTLTVNINDQFIQAYRLRPTGLSGGNRLFVPLIENGQVQVQDALIIPSFQIGSNNQLQFRFAMDYHKAGQCKDTILDAVHSAIDPDSTIDLSSFPHFTAMPNLALFANAGFPFTKYADLAETAVVMPDSIIKSDIEEMLFLLGRMGRMTGVPALRFQIVNNSSATKLTDADLLVIGGGRDKDLLSQWRQDLPAVIEQSHRSFTPAAEAKQWAGELLGNPRKYVSSEWNVAFDAQGPLAAILGFESPLHNGRSVVAITASSPEAHKLATDVLSDEGLIRQVNGDITLIRGRDARAYQVASTYYVGELSWWLKIWFVLSRHPILLSIFGLIAAVTMAFWLYVFLQRLAARRINSP